MGASHSKLQGKDYVQSSTEEVEGRLWYPDEDLGPEEEELRRETHKRPHHAQDAEREENLGNSFNSVTSKIYLPLDCSQISVAPYMTFPSSYYTRNQNYAFPTSRQPTEAQSQREQLLLAANARLQDQVSCLQLENQRLNQLIHQGQSILLERDNLTVVNRDQRRRLEIARQQWEKLQRDHEELKDKVLQQEVLLGELPALRRQVTQADHAKTLLTRRDNEIEVLREEVKSLKHALLGYKRLHKQDLETRVRAATQAKELEDAKTAIIVLKDELKSMLNSSSPGGCGLTKRRVLKLKVGFLGGGNMAKAMAAALVAKRTNGGLLFVTVKPAQAVEVLREAGDFLSSVALVVSACVGVSLATLANAVHPRIPIARIMPNVLCAIGPAFVLTFIEALIDGGVRCGMSRDLAREAVLQSVRGTAILAQMEQQHPAVVRDRITSPGGTTIAGLLAMERRAFRASVAEAVEAAVERSKEIQSTQASSCRL
ncbi:hypothetical protein Emed_005344 [Eimeria media]